MFRTLVCCISLLLVTGVADAKDVAGGDEQLLDGMSIVGNDEAPKSLVIVPWKSSGLGDALAVSRVLDDEYRPVDKDVFMRELNYYEIRAGLRTQPVSQGK